MNIQSHILAGCMAFLFSTAACTPKRPETVSYFREVTGINICESASIRNKKYDAHDYESDPVYQVIIKSDKRCLIDLNNQIIEKFDVDCNLPDSNDCTFTDKKLNWYKIEKNTDGSLLFRLSFT